VTGIGLKKLKKAAYFYPCRRMIKLGLLKGQPDYTKFIILGRPRTGSTLLRSLLNSHSKVLVLGELFRKGNDIGWDMPGYEQNSQLLSLVTNAPARFLETEVFHNYPKGIAAVGFKMFYHDAKTDPQKEIWPYLSGRKDIKIIHITRKNILKTHLSLVRALETGQWYATGKKAIADSVPVHLDRQLCREAFIKTEKEEMEFDLFFDGHPKIRVTYEDLTKDRHREMDKIFNFLGVAYEDAAPSIVKQSGRPLDEMIANYHALKKEFSNTRWKYFFEA
jgi:LPS sulfotransferase NodH